VEADPGLQGFLQMIYKTDGRSPARRELCLMGGSGNILLGPMYEPDVTYLLQDLLKLRGCVRVNDLDGFASVLQEWACEPMFYFSGRPPGPKFTPGEIYKVLPVERNPEATKACE
jgi:hypothetical protein